jgi:hypothetical protein
MEIMVVVMMTAIGTAAWITMTISAMMTLIVVTAVIAAVTVLIFNRDNKNKVKR